MGVTITSLELENIKRIRAFELEPSPSGLTVIGGKNGQGKTSVLDAIAWALGGDRYKPTAAQREGSVLPPELRITLSNGITVTRKGANGNLTVTDESGKKSGQKLLNSFIEEFALNIPKFIESTDKEKAEILLRVIGIKDQLDSLDREYKIKYDKRLDVGRERDQRKAFAEGLTYYEDAPESVIDTTELSQKLSTANCTNLVNMQKRRQVIEISGKLETLRTQMDSLKQQISELEHQYDLASEMASKAEDIDITELTELLRNAGEINDKVRANEAKNKADSAAQALAEQYEALSAEIEDVRTKRKKLLDGADLPLPGLGTEDGILTMNGKPWDCMSSSEQLRSAAAIVSRLKPECKFVLVDKLEQLDADALREFGDWAQEQGMQIIGTRVSTGSECTVIIEDGNAIEPAKTSPTGWKAGEF